MSKQDYMSEGLITIDGCSISDGSLVKDMSQKDDNVSGEKITISVNELNDIISTIVNRLATVESHIKVLYSYVGQQINGNVFDVYVLKCKDRLTDKRDKNKIKLAEKESELKRILQEQEELNETLNELDTALKTSEFPVQIAAIINDRKSSILSRIELLKCEKVQEDVEILGHEIDIITQKINTLSNFIADDLLSE